MLNAAPRLPGIRFEPRAAPLGDALPRMDVAVIVGFAASGPLHLPVAVEDPGQFQAVFGADLPLARDPDTGETVSALLAPTVRAFFANDGRRCWVIRVAGDDARHDHFPLPGLLAATAGEGGGAATLRPAFARARSRGSWADALRVVTALGVRPLHLAADYHGGHSLRVLADGPPAGRRRPAAHHRRGSPAGDVRARQEGGCVPGRGTRPRAADRALQSSILIQGG